MKNSLWKDLLRKIMRQDKEKVHAKLCLKEYELIKKKQSKLSSTERYNIVKFLVTNELVPPNEIYERY